MPDDPTTTGETPAATPPQVGGNPPARAPQADADEPFDRARAMDTIAKLRDFEKQAKAQQRELDALRAEKKKADDAQLSEAEKWRKEADEARARVAELETERQAQTVRAAIERAAQQAGIADTDAAYRLIDLADIQTDEQGRVTNAETLVKKLLTRPLFQQHAASVANAARGTSGTTGGVIGGESYAERRRRLIG